MVIKQDLEGERSLIDELLEEQKRLTAVERFVQRHAREEAPLQERYYRDLIPLTKPAAGEQFAFEVNLDVCSGCKACVTACHNLNGLDDNETWREVGVLLGGTPENALQQTVTTACHHCVDPGCLNGCPVMAYEKDHATGIVRHLDDQCIGCQYCILKCPYEVPRYSASRGIVRKCDMCHSRLTAGEAPACVQACPNGAISIRIVNQREITAQARALEWLPDSPSPTITLPTSRYVTAKSPEKELKAGDHYQLRPAQAHPPLVFMLVLTQLSVGALFIEQMLRWSAVGADRFAPALAALFCCAGLGASVLHLGRPLKAWKSFLGWRTSWLSREVVVFGTYAPMLIGYAAMRWVKLAPEWLHGAAGGLATAAGFGGIWCSAMLYADTQREFWDLKRTAIKFFGTAAVLGSAALFWLAAWRGYPAKLTAGLALVLALASLVKLGFERRFFDHLEDANLTALKRTALLTLGEFGALCRLRFTLGVLGGIILPFFSLFLGINSVVATVIFTFCLGAELCERHLFFTTVAAPKMPGML